MMVVVDASVAVKWYVEEIHDSEAELFLVRDFQLHAPELAIPEFGSIIWKKCRSGSLVNRGALRIIHAFCNEDIVFHGQRSLLPGAVNGANATNQTVYDWTYLTLAVSLSCILVTADYRFYQALKETRFKQHLAWIEDVPKLLS